MKLLILSLGACLAACSGNDRRVAESGGVVAESALAAVDTPPPDTLRRDSAVRRDSVVDRDTAVRDERPRVSVRPDTSDLPAVRALYLNRFAAQSPRRMRHLLAVADSTEINGFVVDMKDEFGLNYRSANPELRKYEGSGRGRVGDVKALVDSIKAHGLVAIARIVAFKDPVAAEANVDWTIRREDGSVWRDKENLAWVSAYNREVWEYNLGVAEELVKLGFDEIQWDYIRFPEPYQSLPKQVFPGAKLSKPDILAEFLKEAQARLSKVGARNTADVFGLVTTVRGPLEVGQHWEKISPHIDVVLPMVYPSHYPRGAYGIPYPNAEPYKVMKAALDGARQRDEKLGITRKEHVRPWIQAFTIGRVKYGPHEISEQKRAIYDAGFKGWVMWSPGSLYDPFIPALEKENP